MGHRGSCCDLAFFDFAFYFIVEVELIYNIVLVLGVQQGDSVKYINVYTYTLVHFYFIFLKFFPFIFIIYTYTFKYIYLTECTFFFRFFPL